MIRKKKAAALCIALCAMLTMISCGNTAGSTTSDTASTTSNTPNTTSNTASTASNTASTTSNTAITTSDIPDNKASTATVEQPPKK